MRRKQYFLLGCGVFPESLTTKISVAAAECAVFLVDKKIPPIITDLPLYGVPVENWIFPPQRSISRDYWQWFDRDEAYFDSLLRPGDEVHAFAYVRDPSHRDVLMELDEFCDVKEARLRLHLF
ncbi:hypothetical protein CE91St43_27140 [Oscillospiraceae bacterium]|nr:hypothetical protein CE91St43_27140 [Oscillospiraceae bacterium]